MDLSVPNHATPKGMGGFKRLVLQGRHRGVEVIGVTQHPALVPTWFRINCAERYLFALGVEDHAVMGTRYRDELARLTPHRFIRFADGAATSGGNPPLGSAADGGSRSGAGAPAPHQVKPTKGGKTTVPWRR